MAGLRIPASGSAQANDNFQYIADMTSELRKMALGAQAATLAHILEVAMLEAMMQKDIHVMDGDLDHDN